MPKTISPETQTEALKIAKGTQRPGQTKEQTKAIAQGIEKGIAEYKKREKARARERDKQRKKEQHQPTAVEPEVTNRAPQPTAKHWVIVPWALLAISWLLFGFYLLFNRW